MILHSLLKWVGVIMLCASGTWQSMLLMKSGTKVGIIA